MTARQPVSTFNWRCALDNYEPAPRSWGRGTGSAYVDDDDETTIVLSYEVDMGKDPHKGVFLLDDTVGVSCWYVAGWHPDKCEIILRRFPTNFDDDGKRRLRADNKQPVDFADWQLGPRKAFHLKVTGGNDGQA